MPELVIDFSNPNALKEALEEIEPIIIAVRTQLERAEQARKEADEDIAQAKRDLGGYETIKAVLMDRLGITGEPEPLPSAQQTTTIDAAASSTDVSTQTALAVLNEAGRPMMVKEVWDRMPGFTRKTVGWALWRLKEDGLARKTGRRGEYAPLSYRPPTDYTTLVGTDFPIPEGQSLLSPVNGDDSSSQRDAVQRGPELRTGQTPSRPT